MRNFLKQTFASLVGTLLGLLIFLGVGIGGLVLLLLVVSSRDSGPRVEEQSILVFDMALNITDARPSSSTTALVQTFSGEDNNRVTLRTVLDTLEKAQRDRRIVGLYLDGSQSTSESSSSGFATLKEVRQALERFRAAGKTIVAYKTDWNEKDYYLSSVANTVVVNPLGAMEINGLSSQPVFFAGALEKFGVGVQVIRVGKFKGSVEPFIQSQLSSENREQLQRLLGDTWREWLDTIGSSRKISPTQLQTIADNQGILLPDEARDRGLVDRVEYFDQVLAQLKQLTGETQQSRTFRQISLPSYAQVSDRSLGVNRDSRNKIAVVYAEGLIVDGQGGVGQVGGDRYAQIIRRLRQDDNTKAIVLRVNSRGGSSTASEVMQRELSLARQVKPVIVSMGDYAASGGYWIATDANRIFAESNTVTGSIGVFGLRFNLQQLANDNGITWDVVKTGRYADGQSVSRPLSAQELARSQRTAERVYNIFLNRVAQSRKLPLSKVAEIAQGRVWSGTAAKEIGLVDEIGGIDAAISYAAQQAKLGDDWELQEYPEARNFEARLLAQLAGGMRSLFQDNTTAQLPASLKTELHRLQAELTALQTMNDPLNVYARLLFDLQID